MSNRQLPSGVTDADQKLLLSVSDVAGLLGVSQRSVWAWARDGSFPRPVALGRLRRWRREDVESWLAHRATVANEGRP